MNCYSCITGVYALNMSLLYLLLTSQYNIVGLRAYTQNMVFLPFYQGPGCNGREATRPSFFLFEKL